MSYVFLLQSMLIFVLAYDSSLFEIIAPSLLKFPEIKATVVYADSSERSTLSKTGIPTLRHLAGSKDIAAEKEDKITEYYYGNVKNQLFATPFQDHWHHGTEAVSHTRNLTFLKKLMNGPFFDLEAIWEEHTYYEFADRSVEHTMSTMVAEPYVNHVPTVSSSTFPTSGSDISQLTGGIGRSKLTEFYCNNFIFNNSDDTELELTSRTIGIDRVIDEFIFKFTHDKQLDWLYVSFLVQKFHL